MTSISAVVPHLGPGQMLGSSHRPHRAARWLLPRRDQTHTHTPKRNKKNRLCSHVKQREQCRVFLLRKPQNRFNIDSARMSQEEQEPGGARRSQEEPGGARRGLGS